MQVLNRLHLFSAFIVHFFRPKRCEIFFGPNSIRNFELSEILHRFPAFELTLQTQQIHKNTVNSKYNSKHSKWSWRSHRSFIHHSSIIYDVSNNWKAAAPVPNLRSTRRTATDPNRPVDVLLGDLAVTVKQGRGAPFWEWCFFLPNTPNI